MSDDLYERSEMDIVNGAEFVLFKVGGKTYKASPLTISRADEWLSKADTAAALGIPVDAAAERLNALQLSHAKAVMGKPDAEPVAEPVDIEALKQQMDEARAAWRTALRQWLDAMRECISAYDEKLKIDELVQGALTDGQVVSAFARLRYFNDPLAVQRLCTAAVLKAQRNALS